MPPDPPVDPRTGSAVAGCALWALAVGVVIGAAAAGVAIGASLVARWLG